MPCMFVMPVVLTLGEARRLLPAQFSHRTREAVLCLVLFHWFANKYVNLIWSFASVFMGPVTIEDTQKKIPDSSNILIIFPTTHVTLLCHSHMCSSHYVTCRFKYSESYAECPWCH
ncbi:hypothetical protein MT325_m760L [Paramecium bursaria chlorella virus MT325]|uniref:Uncharacterized protein m760L n=1 Tax=Paramecium bursaria Chlorella virus MT325 TaxID=346932 RepID=A7IVE0_PBCVM|nr:hypothetical protein MT325_m760L [Paramecium bursaria chlorella virus MT325]